MKRVADQTSPFRGRAAALAVGLVIAGIAAITLQWPAGNEEEQEPQAPAVAESPAKLPAPPAMQPLPGNESSVLGGERHLLLTGTHVARDASDSLAFIGIDPKNPQTYAINAMLVNGARIQAIARDHVLLERDGQVAKLEIGGAWQESSPAVKRLTAINKPSDAAELPEPTRQAVTDGIAISPVFDSSGMLTSLQLRPGRNSTVFSRWGLEPGDHLVAIEGMPLTDLDTAAQMLELVGRGETLGAMVLREGARVNVVLDGGLIQEEKAKSGSVSDSVQPSS